MDAAAGNKSGAGINKNTSSTRRGTARPSAPKANTRLQQNLARQLGGDTSQVPNAPSAARLAANNTTLKILGVRSSKAATNPDKGEKRLLEFLERKASTMKGPSRRHITIKKVCKGIRSMGTEGYAASPTAILVIMPLTLQDDRTIATRQSSLLPFPRTQPYFKVFHLANIH